MYRIRQYICFKITTTIDCWLLECWLLYRYEGATCAGQFHGEGVAYFEGGHMYKVEL